MANTYTKIASATVTGSAGDIQFSNIPQTYTDLSVLISAKGRLTSGNVGALVVYTANGQSSSLSTWKEVRGDGTGVASYNNAYPIIGLLTYQAATVFSSVNLYIPNYTSSNKKVFNSDSVTEENTTYAYQSLSGLTIDYTTAISFLGFGDGSAGGGLAVGSSITLYGIKNS